MKALLALCLLVPTLAHADPGDRWDGVMMAEQLGGGFVGGAALGAGTMFLGARLADSSNDGTLGLGTAGGVAVLAAAGVVVGSTVGVKLTGDWRGGNGTWLATSGGAAAGTLVTLLTLPSYGERVPWPVAAGIASMTVIAPAILGYQLTTDENADKTEKRVVVPLLMMPF